MIPENLKKQIFIIQQVREEDKTKLILEYKKIKIDFILKTFFNDLQNQIYNSDIVLHVVDRQRLLKLKTQKRLLFFFHYQHLLIIIS